MLSKQDVPANVTIFLFCKIFIICLIFCYVIFLLIGCCYSKPLLVPGGRAFVWPAIQRVQKISLNTMTLQVESPTVYTSQGVPISVTGIAQVFTKSLIVMEKIILV